MARESEGHHLIASVLSMEIVRLLFVQWVCQ
jgi:hypothetical protein